MGSKKFGVLEEATAHRIVALDVGEADAHPAAQDLQVVVGRVGQGGRVQVSPERFDRVEFGGIRREPLDAQPPTVLLQSALGEAAAVGREAVPKEKDSTSPMTPEGSEEADELGAADTAWVKGQEPAQTLGGGCGQHEADAREALPIERLAQAGCLTLGSPGGANRRPL